MEGNITSPLLFAFRTVSPTVMHGLCTLQIPQGFYDPISVPCDIICYLTASADLLLITFIEYSIYAALGRTKQLVTAGEI